MGKEWRILFATIDYVEHQYTLTSFLNKYNIGPGDVVILQAETRDEGMPNMCVKIEMLVYTLKESDMPKFVLLSGY